jgi:hypothetical protein
MIISELITELQQIESTHGNLQVRIEAKAIGLTYDDGGNECDDRTISAPAERLESGVHEGAEYVWLIGTAEPEPDLDEDDAEDQASTVFNAALLG